MKEFKVENITRWSNLPENDSISCYMGHGAQQNGNAYEVFYNFLREVKPDRILEIGTGMGGFTVFLALIKEDLDLNMDILSYDIHGRVGFEQYASYGIDARIKDVFSGNYTDVSAEVIEYIRREGTTVILCDGGNKIEEFNLLSNYLKTGDFIMAHDYSANPQYFKEHVEMKIWNWMEIQDSDINDAVVKNNLEPFMADEFQQAVWVCKIKE